VNVVFALLLAFGTLLAQTQISTPAPQPTAPDPVPLRSVEHTIPVGGIERTYFVYRPMNLKPGAHPPLVVAMHGGGSIAQGVETHYFWDQEADRGGFVVVFPQAINKIWSNRDNGPVDDVTFLTVLVRRMEIDEGVDPRRIFFTGMSSGALMSYKMACAAKFPIAGIAPVAGTLNSTCANPQKTSLLAINGDADRMIPYYGGKNSAPANPAMNNARWQSLPPVPDVLAKWRALDGCAEPAATTGPQLTTQIAQCLGGREVEGILVAGAGHQWPGGAKHDPAAVAAYARAGIFLDEPAMQLDATPVIWKFFSTKMADVPVRKRFVRSTRHSIVVDGRVRTYSVYHPAGVGANAPLVVALHGGFGVGVNTEEHTHWDPVAERGKFVAAFPDGAHGWNWGGCCGNGQKPGTVDPIDDVKFLTMMVARIEATDRVDRRRVYFTGFSAGANMTFRMACQAKIPIAAIAPVAGTVDTACDHPQPLSVLSLNGTLDTQIPIAGGKSTGPYVRDVLPSIPSVLNKWRAIDRCKPASPKISPPVTVTIDACPHGRTVEWIVIDGAGHQWPGSDPPTALDLELIRSYRSNLAMPSQALNATDTVWKFFSGKVSTR